MPNAFGQPDDPFSTPDGQAWARAVHDDLVPKLTESALSVTIFSGGVDVKLAVELGAAILLDKPIVLVVQSGVKVPDHLVRAADKILEADLADPAATTRKIQAALADFDIA